MSSPSTQFKRTALITLCSVLAIFASSLPAAQARNAAAGPAPTVALSTNNPGNMFAPGQPVSATVALTLPSGSPHTYSFSVTEQDYTGTTTALLTTTVTLSAGQPYRTVVPVPTHGFGYYELDVCLVDPGQICSLSNTKALSIGVMNPQSQGMDPVSPFGAIGSLTQAYGNDPRKLAAAASAMTAAGVRYDREELNWQTIEKTPGSGQFDFSREDAGIVAAHNAGIQVLGLLAYWGNLPQPDTTVVYSGTDKLNQITGCSKGPACAYTPQGDALFAQYAAAVVNHYKPGGALAQQQGWTDGYGITNWEVWNEPSTIAFWRHDLAGYPDLFAALYKPAYAAIHGADPSAKVMYDESGPAIDAALAANGSVNDILAVHSYSGGLDPDAALASPTLPRGGQGTAPAAVSEFVAGGKPVWLTETGYPTDGTVTPRQQADYLVRSFVNFLALGVRKEFWFKFHEDSPGGDNLYSLVNNDFSPKPSYLAYATMSHHLAGTTFAQSVQLGTAVRADLFNGSGLTVAVLWSTAESGSMALSLAGTQATAYDLMDNPIAQQASAGLTLPLSGDPIFLNVPNMTSAQLAGLLQSARISTINPIGVTVQPAPGLSNGLPDIKATVSARTNVPITGTVTLQLPAGWSATPISQRFPTLQPGQSTTIIFHLNSEVNHKGDTIVANATTPTGFSATGSSPVTPYAMTYGHPKIDGTLATWTTASEADLINLHPDQVVGIPGWTPQNLSARVYTMWDQQYFYLAADVHDVHFDYAPIGYNMYKGDSIQYGWGMDPAAWNNDQGQNRFNVTAGLTHQGPANFQYNLLAPWPDMQVQIKPDPSTGDLIYTTAVPWSRLGSYVPKAGNQFAFNLIINQNENGNRIGWIQFAPGIGIGFRPSQWPLWTIEQSNPAAGLRLGGLRAPLQGSINFDLTAAQGHLDIHNGGMRAINLIVNGTPISLAAGTGPHPLARFGTTSIDLSQYLHAGTNTVQASGVPISRADAAVLSFFQ